MWLRTWNSTPNCKHADWIAVCPIFLGNAAWSCLAFVFAARVWKGFGGEGH